MSSQRIDDELEPFTITGGKPKAANRPVPLKFGARKDNGAKIAGLFGKASADSNLFKRSDTNRVIINVKMYEGGRLISGLAQEQKEKIINSLQLKKQR